MSTTTRRQTTTRINGKRIRLVTQNGKTVATDAPIEEWVLQAAAVRAMRAMPEFDKTFALAADFNAGKRDATKAKATGVTAGETDLRVYAAAGRLLLIEYKNAEGRLSGEQVKRHALLRELGYTVEVIKATTPDECASLSVELVRGWLEEGAVSKDEEFGRYMGYLNATSDVMNLLNTYEQKVVPKKDIYHAVADMRPPSNNNTTSCVAA